MNLIFLGGPAHGKIYNIEPHLNSLVLPDPPLQNSEIHVFSNCEYKRQTWVSPTLKTVDFFIASGLRPTEQKILITQHFGNLDPAPQANPTTTS